MKTALLLIAHGSRQEPANADLYCVAAALRERDPYTIVETAFLELVEPTILQAGRACVAQGAERVILLPYFLSAGVHARRDLQDYRDRLSTELAPVVFYLGEPLGPHPLLVDILAQRAQEAEQGLANAEYSERGPN